jgi:hypothetical protein
MQHQKYPLLILPKKGGQTTTLPTNNSSLAEEIVVTTSYKPVLAEAVKIRRNPDLEDKTPFKAPLNYTPLDKKLDQDNNIRAAGSYEKARRARLCPAEQLC